MILSFLAALAWHGCVLADDAVRALDGDTLEIDGRVIDLYGIDAPESEQMCVRDGRPWACGREAARVLALLAKARPVRCRVLSGGRSLPVLAVCKSGDFDLAAEMVNRGLAVLAPEAANPYLANLREARAVGMGIYGGLYVAPAAWRAGARLSFVPTP